MRDEYLHLLCISLIHSALPKTKAAAHCTGYIQDSAADFGQFFRMRLKKPIDIVRPSISRPSGQPRRVTNSPGALPIGTRSLKLQSSQCTLKGQASTSRCRLQCIFIRFDTSVCCWRSQTKGTTRSHIGSIKVIRIVFALSEWAGTDGSCLEAEEAGADNRRLIGVYSLPLNKRVFI